MPRKTKLAPNPVVYQGPPDIMGFSDFWIEVGHRPGYQFLTPDDLAQAVASGADVQRTAFLPRV